MVKNLFWKNAITPNLLWVSESKSDIIIFRPVFMLCWSSYLLILLRNEQSKSVWSGLPELSWVGSGRAGSGWASSSRIWVLHIKTMFFCSIDYAPNTILSGLCEFPYVIAEGGSRLQVTTQVTIFFLLRKKRF